MEFNSEDGGGIRAEMIVEVIGRPPAHLIETLNKIIAEIDKEDGVRVLGKKVKEPQLMKEQQELYTAFAEIEVEVKEILYLVMLMFKYMPAHVEIVTPEAIALTNNGWNEILNELIRRLHGYDEVARILQVEKSILEKRLRELMGEKSKENMNPVTKEKSLKKSKK